MEEASAASEGGGREMVTGGPDRNLISDFPRNSTPAAAAFLSFYDSRGGISAWRASNRKESIL